MPKSGAYEISLLVNGQPLREYDPPDDDAETDSGKVVKYIEAIEGAEFHIQIKVAPRTQFPISFKTVDVKVDGKSVDCFSVYEQRHGSSRRGWARIRKGRSFVEGGSYVWRPLIFKALSMTEEAMPLETIKQLARSIGCIHIEIYDVTCTAKEWREEKHQIDQSVPEKALKGQPIDMTAGYGSATAIKRPGSIPVHRVGKPLAKFGLKYRSRRALQILDLIPTTPEPEPLEERNIDTLNPEEMRQLLTQMRDEGNQLSGQHTKVKKETTLVKEERDPGIRAQKRQSSTLEDNDDDCVIVEVKKRKFKSEEVDVLDLT